MDHNYYCLPSTSIDDKDTQNKFCILWLTFVIVSVTCQSRHNYNPTIIQDSRLEPKVDGTFGFLYRTEDGISHAAKGDPTGYVQGSYSYKDPTGLKVNFNYFAGAKKTPTSASPPVHQSAYRASEEQYRDRNSEYSQPEVQQDYYLRETEQYEPPQEYRPRTRPPTSYTRSRTPTYEPIYTSRTSSRFNEVYDVDDYQYRG